MQLQNRTRHPYITSMENFVYHEVCQRNLFLLVFVELHALAVKSNLGKSWRNRNFKFLLEIAKNPDVGDQFSLFSLPVYAFTISKSLNILNE